MVKHFLLVSMWALIALTFLNGCCCKLKIRLPCCIEGRRPQIMTDSYDEVKDYSTSYKGSEAEVCLGPFADDCSDLENENSLSDDQNEENASSTETDSNSSHPVYVLSIGDVLEISVLGDEEISSTFVSVAPDGRIYYAFLDGIPAAGRTTAEVSQEIESKLQDLFIHPMVTISPLETTPKTYKILGRVQQPGVYEILGNTNLRDAIGQAGGILTDSGNYGGVVPSNSLANLRASFIVRNHKKLDVHFEKIFSDPKLSQNVIIQPGDYIYIAAAENREVFILGAVRNPQRMPFRNGLTVMSALASVSGWRSYGPYGADITRVLVIRGSLDCPCVIQINLKEILRGQARDLYLVPGDILFAQNKTMRFGRELVRIAIGAFVSSFVTAAAGYYAERWFPIPPAPVESVSGSH